MKRDMDYIRELLLKIEESEDFLTKDNCMICNKKMPEVEYHLSLLKDAGYIDGIFVDADNHLHEAVIKGLTWDGQDYLDTMRDDQVWIKAKKVVKNTLGSTTLDLIKEVCHELSKKALMNGINLI